MGYDYLPTVTKKAICRKIFNTPPSPNFNANTAEKQVDVLTKIVKALELVQLENVPYVIDDSFTTKIVIFIRLSETVRLEVNVPYSNYQIVLQNTQAAIKAIREFADKGIAINVRTSGATTPFYKWKIPNQ